MIAEAIDLLEMYKNYFKQFIEDNSVESKTINFSVDTEYESLNIDKEQIKILNDLGFELSFDIYGK